LPLVRRPIRVSNGIGLALRWAVSAEGSGDMITQELTETRHVNRRSSGPAALTAVVAIIVLVGLAVVAWVMRDDEGPVATDEAQIEITFGDDGTSFVGDREITEGTVTVAFSNETDSVAIVALFGYTPGSAGLAEELEFLEEGDRGVPIGTPEAGYFEVDIEGSDDVAPGSHTWTMDLEPGTYLFDVGPEDFHTTGLWRAAVIEVVAK
jgi:hypothetical protein